MTRDDSVRAVIHVPPPTDNFVNVISSSRVGIYGFEVAGTQADPQTNGSGISVYGGSHHVAIWQNTVHDFPGGGINCFDYEGSHDLVDICFNTIYSTSKRSPNNTSGISIFAGQDLTHGRSFTDGYGYQVVGNYIYDVECIVPFVPGGFNFVTDGNGILLDKITTSHGYAKPILVADNIVTGCGGRAVLAYETERVLMIRNTAIGNLRTVSPAISGGAELEGKTDGSVRIVANTIFPLHSATIYDSTSSIERNVILGGAGAVRDNDHPRVWLNRGQGAGDRGETEGGLPGASADLEHSWTGAAGEGDHVLDEPGRISRADSVISLRDLTEDPCPHPIRHQHTVRRRLSSRRRRNVRSAICLRAGRGFARPCGPPAVSVDERLAEPELGLVK